jgi:hypothetical protein
MRYLIQICIELYCKNVNNLMLVDSEDNMMVQLSNYQITSIVRHCSFTQYTDIFLSVAMFL